VDPNWPNPMGPNDADIIIYGFVPSKIICVLAFVFFGIAFIAHFFQAIYHRTWYFSTFTLGIAMEIGGYIPRYFSATKDPYMVNYFVAQYFLIVCAPVALTAAIYACLYKMALSAAQQSNTSKKIWSKPRWILWVFIIADIITTGLQVAGAAMIGAAESNGEDPSTANNILLAGLAVQTASFTLFIITFGLFINGLRNRQTSMVRAVFVVALIGASFLILLRIVFRLAETAGGVFSYVMTHEAFFGALEFAPIVVATLVLALWHPSRYILHTQKGTVEPRINQTPLAY
jgi:heme/copper-type cytochrome/quinol oxidase subunit 3